MVNKNYIKLLILIGIILLSLQFTFAKPFIRTQSDERQLMKLCMNDSQCWDNPNNQDDNYCLNRFCRNPFTSSRPVTTTCRINEQCNSRICHVRFGATFGFCVFSSLPNGQSCIRHDQCISEFCEPNRRSCQINPNLALGIPCTYNVECTSRLCVFNNAITQTECAQAYIRNNGNICTDNRECLSGFCYNNPCRNNGCNPNSNPGVCTSPYFKGLYEPCRDNEECKSNVCTNNQCTEDRIINRNQQCDQDAQCKKSICVLELATTRKSCQLKGLSRLSNCFEDRQCSSQYCVRINYIQGVCS